MIPSEYQRSLAGRVDCLPAGRGTLIFREEILFFIFFLLWTYVAGFRPEAHGTEKFMDYGFMEAMMRSSTLPARDPPAQKNSREIHGWFCPVH